MESNKLSSSGSRAGVSAKIFSIVTLALIACLSFMPTVARAAEGDPPTLTIPSNLFAYGAMATVIVGAVAIVLVAAKGPGIAIVLGKRFFKWIGQAMG